MTLGELIRFLESVPPETVAPIGFGNPHSYRGYYHDLAFEPVKIVPVRLMLNSARSAMGATYEGYKGGDYTMGERTNVWLANYGDTGEGIGPVLLRYMTGQIPPYAPSVTTDSGERREAGRTRNQENREERTP